MRDVLLLICSCLLTGSFGDSSKRKATTSGAGTSEYLDVQASNMKSTDPGLPELNESSNSSSNTQPSALAVMDKKQGNVIGKSPESVSEHVKRESRSNSRRTNMQVDKQEMFDPFTEGSELKLPVKYRKLKAASAKLYSELEKIADNRETSLACQQFLHDVESVFDMGNIPTYSELQGRATELLEEHEKLSALVNNVVHRSHTIGDDSPWPEVYKCYRHWQIVLNKFHELQKKTQQLLKGKRSQLLWWENEMKGQTEQVSIHAYGDPHVVPGPGPVVTSGSSFLLYLIRRISSWAFTGIQTKKLIERSWEPGCFLFLLQRAEKPKNKKLKQATFREIQVGFCEEERASQMKALV